MDTLSIPVPVKLENISSMLCTAIETSAIMYWCNRVEIAAKPTKKAYKSSFTDDHDAMFDIPMNGGALFFYEYDEDDGSITKHRLGMQKIQKGLAIMAVETPHLFSYLLKGEDDSDSADAFLQCCLFGKIIYG